MQIIISPAKQMKTIEDNCFETTCPLFLNQVNQLKNILCQMDVETIQKYMKCSQTIAQKTYHSYQTFDKQIKSPALLSYSGIQYQYMACDVFTDDEISYLQNHLWILSGLYGALRPLDEIVNYRLEMQTKIPFSLYDFWKDQLSKVIPQEPILNLASEEYAKCIRKYRELIDVSFCEFNGKKYVEKGVYAKMARGRMVRFLAEHKIENIEQIKRFCDLGYSYSNSLSHKNQMVFIKN